MIKILLADDHKVVRDALRYFLEAQEDMQVVGMAANGAEAVQSSKLSCPNIVVMDISMPHMDGIEATRRICEFCPETRVVILTFNKSLKDLQNAVQAGASGYIVKDYAAHELIPAVRALYNGGRYFGSPFATLDLTHILKDEPGISNN